MSGPGYAALVVERWSPAMAAPLAEVLSRVLAGEGAALRELEAQAAPHGKAAWVSIESLMDPRWSHDELGLAFGPRLAKAVAQRLKTPTWFYLCAVSSYFHVLTERFSAAGKQTADHSVGDDTPIPAAARRKKGFSELEYLFEKGHGPLLKATGWTLDDVRARERGPALLQRAATVTLPLATPEKKLSKAARATRLAEFVKTNSIERAMSSVAEEALAAAMAIERKKPERVRAATRKRLDAAAFRPRDVLHAVKQEVDKLWPGEAPRWDREDMPAILVWQMDPNRLSGKPASHLARHLRQGVQLLVEDGLPAELDRLLRDAPRLSEVDVELARLIVTLLGAWLEGLDHARLLLRYARPD